MLDTGSGGGSARESDVSFDILIIGGGPAGIAAAWAATRGDAKARVGLIDSSPEVGGQIWRRQANHPGSRQARLWFERAQAVGLRGQEAGATPNLVHLPETKVLAVARPGELLVQSVDAGPDEPPRRVAYQRLILATGARERFLPFPGWTIPGVVGAGGSQALVKNGAPIAGKRVVIAGSGPLLVAVAVLMKSLGADVALVAEQASMWQTLPFLREIASRPAKWGQAFDYRRRLGFTPMRNGAWPKRAIAGDDGALAAMELSVAGHTRTFRCDYLACGFHLIPQTELAEALGCRIERDGRVAADGLCRTSVEGVFTAGESTGVAGVDKALVEGQIAGHVATDRRDRAEALAPELISWRRFGRALDRAFAPRPELRDLPDADTIVCRCEDIRHGRLAAFDSWREAKLLSRCGMGPCQGRVCGGAVEHLYGWRPASKRPPILPAPAGAFLEK